MTKDTRTAAPDRRSKIQNVQQFIDWYNQGMSYSDMAKQWMKENDDVITPAAFSNLRVRLGLRPRLAQRDPKLIPWVVRSEHYAALPMRMFHTKTRQAHRLPVNPEMLQRLAEWEALLKAQNLVVHYEPNTDQGFFYVPAREGIDNGLIREPGFDDV